MKIFNINNLKVNESSKIKNELDVKEQIAQNKVARKENDNVINDIHLVKFDNVISKMKNEKDLSIEEINALREELKNNSVSSETLGTSMIEYFKENTWRKKL